MECSFPKLVIGFRFRMLHSKFDIRAILRSNPARTSFHLSLLDDSRLICLPSCICLPSSQFDLAYLESLELNSSLFFQDSLFEDYSSLIPKALFAKLQLTICLLDAQSTKLSVSSKPSSSSRNTARFAPQTGNPTLRRSSRTPKTRRSTSARSIEVELRKLSDIL